MMEGMESDCYRVVSERLIHPISEAHWLVDLAKYDGCLLGSCLLMHMLCHRFMVLGLTVLL